MSERDTWRACLLIAAVLLTVPASAGAGVFKKDFDAKGLRQVEVTLRGADLKVLAHDAARIEVRSSAHQLCAEQRGDVLHIDDEQVPQGQQVELTLRLPAALALKAKVASGDVEAEGAKGKLELKVVSGDVRVRHSGALKLKAVSGDVEVAGAEGTVKVVTVSGGVRIKDLRGERLKVKTVSGDVRIEDTAVEEAELHAFSGDIRFAGRLPAGGELEAETFSGGIDIRLPADPGYDLEAKSNSGEVHVGSALQVYEKSKRRVRAKAGAGGVDVRAKTFSGEVRIETTK